MGPCPAHREETVNAIANFFTKIVSRYMPDPLVVAIILTALTVVFAMLSQGVGFFEATTYWGDGFWNLLAFTMQMTIILLAGYILARTPAVDKLMDVLIQGINSPRTAVVVATMVGGVGSWLNWGFGLVLGTLIAQKLGRKVKGLHYPLVIAAGYSGFAVYGVGLFWLCAAAAQYAGPFHGGRDWSGLPRSDDFLALYHHHEPDHSGDAAVFQRDAASEESGRCA